MVPPGLGFPDGDFGIYARRVCRQWARDPALASRLVGVRHALRQRCASELLMHVWSADMAAVLGELEWAVEFSQVCHGRGQMLLLPTLRMSA